VIILVFSGRGMDNLFDPGRTRRGVSFDGNSIATKDLGGHDHG
jgi:hypothetical protein